MTRVCSIVIGMIVLVAAADVGAEGTISVKPIGVNGFGDIFSFDIGVELGPIAPFLSFCGVVFQGTGDLYDAFWGDYTDPETGETDNLEMSSETIAEGTVSFETLIPSVGLRLKVLGRDPIRAYVFASAFRAITTVSVEGTVIERYYDESGLSSEYSHVLRDGTVTTSVSRFLPNGTIEESDEDETDIADLITAAEELLSPIGGSGGIGVEYRLSDHLGLFGEFAANLLLPKAAFSREDSFDNDEDRLDDWKREVTGSLQARIGITRTSLGVRFHF